MKLSSVSETQERYDESRTFSIWISPVVNRSYKYLGVLLEKKRKEFVQSLAKWHIEKLLDVTYRWVLDSA